ncbi:MAG TPA: response regulator [Planctomycetaceae bacterium]|nr:response regulator [Planctomycetaceae bacterium]
MSSPLILLVEDEQPIRRFLRSALNAEGYRLAEAETAQQATRLATQQPPDLVILDLGLPDQDGQVLLEQLREWLNAPIIVLSARSQDQQKVIALDHGADDYLTKPFSTEELLARIRVALRHATRLSGGTEAESATFTQGDLRVDLAARHVFVQEQEVHLTPIEYKLLTTLIRHAGRVLTHSFLLNEVWGPDHVRESHYLRVFMAHLRRKIEANPAQPRYLLTEQGVGYRFAEQ